MGSKKKRGSKVTVESRTEAVQTAKPDMSKYAGAYSNKSKFNYAELKLLRPAREKTDTPSENTSISKESKKQKQETKKPEKKQSDAKSAISKPKKKKDKKAAAAKDNASTNKGKTKDNASNNKGKAKDNARKNRSEAKTAVVSAEERYSNALGKEDHYSSAVEKYYLKYPDKKRPEKTSSARRSSKPKRTKKKSPANNGATGKSKLSMAEIAVRNKKTPSVKEHARAARNATARGVVSSKVANRPFYPRKKKRPGALNVLMITLLLVFLASVGVTVFFNIRNINVTGDNPYGNAKIMSVCGIRKGSNILFLASEEIENRVEKELPYISECKIQRRLPSTVTIKVTKADVLGVAQSSTGQWSVISSDGKLLESSTNQILTGSNDNNDQEKTPAQSPDYSSATEIAESRKLPLLTGLDIILNTKDGFITDEKQLGYIGDFAVIKAAFEAQKMKLTAIKHGERGYEAIYDGRITVVFGEKIDAKTIVNRLKELYSLIYKEGYISENSKGEIRFSNDRVYFRPEYEVSEEEVQRIHEQRRETNRQQLYEMAEIFMATGDDWIKGKIKSE